MNQIEKSVDFPKGDKLNMIVPAVVHWGADEWDGFRSVEEMFYLKDEVYLKSLPKYTLNLVSPYDLKDEDFSKFNTNWVRFLNL